MIKLFTFNFCGWTLISEELQVKFFTSDNEILVRTTSDKEILFSALFFEDTFTITESASHLVAISISLTEKSIIFRNVIETVMLITEGEFDAYTEF